MKKVVVEHPVEIDPDLRDWEYDGYGVKRNKKTFEVYTEPEANNHNERTED